MNSEKSPAPDPIMNAAIWVVSFLAAYYMLTDIDILHLDMPFLQRVIIIAATISGLYYLISNGLATAKRFLGNLSNK